MVLYMKFDQSVEVGHRDIILDNICKLTCEDKKLCNTLKGIKIINVKDKEYGRYIISVLAVIEKIKEIYPTLDIMPIGSPDFVLTYRKPKKQVLLLEIAKVVFVSVASFVGAAFTILTFNNDVGAADVFEKVYTEFTGQTSDGFTVLEVTYSIGVGLGIVIFFNHFFGRRLSTDPTPLEVEMKKYETDINTMLIDTCTREESIMDVD